MSCFYDALEIGKGLKPGTQLQVELKSEAITGKHGSIGTNSKIKQTRYFILPKQVGNGLLWLEWVVKNENTGDLGLKCKYCKSNLPSGERGH